MRKSLRVIIRALDYLVNLLTNASAWLAWVCLFGMAVLIAVDIIGRTFFQQSVYVADELSGYFLVAITFMAAAYTLVQGRHIRVTVILNTLPPRARRNMAIANSILALAFTAIVAWYSLNLPLTSLEFGTVAWTRLNTPMFIPQLIAPVGLFMLSLAILAHTIRLIRPSEKPGVETQ